MFKQVSLKIAGGIEDFHVQELIAQLAKEALDMAILPRRAGLDETSLDSLISQDGQYKEVAEGKW